MTDPRQSLPDVILTSPDGERLLARCSQLLVQADRGQPISITVDCELLVVRSEMDGTATKTSRVIARRGWTIPLTGDPRSPSPELALQLAMWMASLAEPLGTKMPELIPVEAQP